MPLGLAVPLPAAIGLGVVGAAIGLWLVLRVDPAWWLSLGIVATAFTSHWHELGVPLPVDRLLLAVGIGVTVLRIGPARDRPPIRLGWVHLLLGATIAYAVASAIWADTINESQARYEILDRLGIVPFVLYAIGPVVYRDQRRRGILLGVLVVFGLYLGITAIAEGAKPLHSLVWPHYILDPNYGLHANRARGPFVESVGNGIALIACVAAAAMAMRLWRRPLALWAARLAFLACGAGVVLTYTRSVWIGAAVAFVACLVAYPDLRRKLVPIAVIGTAALGIAIAAVPGLGSNLSERYNESGPIWVRRQTGNAALNMIAAKPVFGFGWGTFQQKSEPYFHDLSDIPLVGANENVHSVPLGRIVELGLVGAGLWAFSLIVAFGLAPFRRMRRERGLWQRGYVVVLLSNAIVVLLTPEVFPFAAMLTGAWAGLLMSRPEEPPASA